MEGIGRFEHRNSCPGRDAARSPSRSAASQNRDSGFFESQVTGAPGSAAHRPSASKTRVNALMAKSYALRCVRGTRVCISRRSRTCECIPIPVPRTSLILIVSCPVRGASRGVRKWDRARAGRRGNPKADAAPGDVPRKHGLGRPWVSVRPVTGVCHCELAGRGQASGAKTPCSRTSTGVCQVPGRTDQGLKTPRRDAERRCRVPLFS
jgi:hypothetical protein